MNWKHSTKLFMRLLHVTNTKRSLLSVMVITVCYASKNLAAAILATGELTGTRLFPFLKNQCGDVEGTGER
ncbi:hypothetical protein T08_15500 [Trichinella sp. T8]|nr:hypothetical protein T08_15500 [Trichinella sp. T8]